MWQLHARATLNEVDCEAAIEVVGKLLFGHNLMDTSNGNSIIRSNLFQRFAALVCVYNGLVTIGAWQVRGLRIFGHGCIVIECDDESLHRSFRGKYSSGSKAPWE